MARSTLFAILVALLLMPHAALRAQDVADSARISRLIADLGSASFRQRQHARQVLETLGEATLEPLRQALHHPNAEVRRHARELVGRLERRLNTEKTLRPTRVRLVYQDTPLSQILADLSRQSGIPIHLEGEAKVGADERLSVDGGETTFWEAIDLLKARAQLHEKLEALPKPRTGSRKSGKRIILLSDTSTSDTLLRMKPVTLLAGSPPSLPRFQLGALRLRARPITETSGREIKLMLEVAVEARLSWENVIALHIHRAIDDQGQRLLPLSAAPEEDSEVEEVILWRGPVVPALNRGRRLLPVTLSPGPKPSSTLRELRGVLSAWVRTPPEPLITVDSLLDQKGKECTGSDGSVLAISKIAADRGEYELQLELTPAPQSPPGGAEKLLALGGVQVKVYYSERDKNCPFTALDARGQPLLLATGHSAPGGGGKQLVNLTYLARKGQGPPVRLIYTNRRSTCISVPFVLRDVPLGGRTGETPQEASN